MTDLRLSLPVLLAALHAPPALGQRVLTVEVHNVRVARGLVRVDVCPEAKFLADGCPWAASAPARVGTTKVTIAGLPAGRYAAQVFLDENANGKVDRAIFGIPKEGVGFSNDARITLGPPKFTDAAFAFDGGAATIGLNLRYFIGARGPGAAR